MTAEATTDEVLKNWTKKAILISMEFEGEGQDWGNPVGNFDGAGLTCGALGWTIKWNNQQPLVLECEKRHPGIIQRLMPKKGTEYLLVCHIKEGLALTTVNDWSNDANVKEPYRSELKTLWSSPEMIEIQVEFATKTMGAFAYAKCIDTKKYFKFEEPRFQDFSYWFDQAVLNGTGHTHLMSETEHTTIDTVFEWMSQIKTGYCMNDFTKNNQMWFKMNLDPYKKIMLILAMLRSNDSRSQFKTVTMNRRGTLAIGTGYVNGTLRTYDWA